MDGIAFFALRRTREAVNEPGVAVGRFYDERLPNGSIVPLIIDNGLCFRQFAVEPNQSRLKIVVALA